MLDLFQIGKDQNIKAADSACQGLGPIVGLIKHGLFPIVQLGIPLVLIALGTVDLGKAVIASNEEAIKKAQGMLIKRAIYAAAIFFIASIVTVVMQVVSSGAKSTGADTDTWRTCWNKA